jgi:hypothetical protein
MTMMMSYQTMGMNQMKKSSVRENNVCFVPATEILSSQTKIHEIDEDWEERLRILEDARQLKEIATHYLHPEEPVSSVLGARCFFDRASAPPCLSKEEADELSCILDDAKALKESAIDYFHPEIGVVTKDPTAFGRNYFSRASGSDEAMECDEEERSKILIDAYNLKKIAVNYLHPELPVASSDGTAFGRNYFSRSSGVEYDDDTEERDRIMNDLQALKKLAVDFMHPELPVVSDPCAFGRNYFTRPSAHFAESDFEDEERDQVLRDMEAMKKLAMDYLHPEKPIPSFDPLTFGRNYFTRHSACEQDECSDEERAAILQDASLLKASAVDYLHPELPVKTSDPFACGRNYFTRSSAPEYSSVSQAAEKEQIMKDVVALKQLATDYYHPEIPISTDPTCFGRNFFTRPSAYVESLSDAVYRSQVMEDMKAFKSLAVDFLHPENPVNLFDSMSYGRNFYSRPSAPPQESLTDAKIRKEVIEDMKALKKYAVDFLHPEIPLSVEDPTLFARSFFSRPSGLDEEYLEERELILSEMKAMKKLAIDYLHPEIPVVTSDSTACGRNYFTRPGAAECADDNERELVLQDATNLKELARDYRHPELPVVPVDPTRCARNFFTRPSAYTGEEEVAERELIIRDSMALKQLAVDYMHPELPVKTEDPAATGRNFFDRPSAIGHYSMIHTFPPHEDELDDHHHSEHLDHFGMDDYGLDYELHMYEEIRENFAAFPQQQTIKQETEEGGNLSRSPSSVMLFCEDVSGP